MVLHLVAVEMGDYINGFKLIPIASLSLIWLRLLTWADKDADNARLPREFINTGNIFGWLLALAATIPLPYFAALPVFVVVFAIEIGVYLALRNQKVGLKDLKQEFTDYWRNFGKKEKVVTASEGAVVLIDSNGKSFPPPSDEAPERAAYETVQSVLSNPMKLGADRIDVRPNEGGSALRYTIDGVTLEGKTFTRDVASAGIDLVKELAGMDVSNRRKPQTGKMKIGTEDKKKHEAEISTAGSTSGELMRVRLDHKLHYQHTIDTLGLLSDQHKTLSTTIADSGGVVLLTVPDGQGQTSLAYAILKKHDAFLSHIQTLERESEIDLEGITQTKVPPGATPADEAKQVSWMISQEPDVIFIDRIESPLSAIDLARCARNGRRVYVGMKAASTFDALAQWRKMIGDDTLAMDSLKLIVAERLVRVLCEACKISYTPDPEALRKMNMSAERVSKLHQARKEPMRDPKGNELICPFCHGLAFKGRTGVFEFFRIDDDVRTAVAGGGTVNQFKGLFRKQKQRYLQEAALSRVEAGDTSVEEVLRVLRGTTPSSGTSSRRAPVPAQ